MTIHLRAWGELACFTRPEMKFERDAAARRRERWPGDFIMAELFCGVTP